MKKILAIMLATIMVFAMTACDDVDDVVEESEVTNPVTACTSAKELMKATGISIDAPKGATDVSYSYISDSDEDGTEYIAQVDFTLDGVSYNYRCESTDERSIFDDDAANNQNASDAELQDMMNDAIEDGAELAGLNYKFGASASVDLEAGPEAIVAFNEGKEGFIAWVDLVPGFMYSLSMNEGASQDLLMTTADKTFVSMQGDTE